MLKVALSGMPECTLGMNDRAGALAKKGSANPTTSSKRSFYPFALKLTYYSKGRSGIAIDDFSFHHCVRLTKFDAERVISFIPPDGEFELMRYRTAENINLPFKIFHNVNEIGRSRVDIRMSIKATFDAEMFATDVKVVPLKQLWR